MKRSGIARGMSQMARTPMTRGRKRLRSRPDVLLAAWGRRVRERDGHICRFPGGCSTGDTRVDPHYIAPRGRRRDLAYVDANGICLCRFHHDWVHTNPLRSTPMGLLSDDTYEKAAKEHHAESL